MKKRIITLTSVILILVMLTGCVATDTTTLYNDGNDISVDKSSYVEAIYSSVYSKIEQEMYSKLYSELYSEFVTNGIDADTLQQQIYQVVDGAAKGNIGITNYQEKDGVVAAYATGSGVIYERLSLTDSTYKYRYYFITNEHVVDGGVKFTADFSDETSIEATLVGKDATTDIACLYFDTDRVFQVVSLGNSEEVKVGSIVLAVGNPKGQTLYGSVSFGIVGGTNRNLIEGSTTNSINEYIQHDAAINAGNSGGGLYNLDGECIGINSVKYVSSEIEGLNFAIPINLVKEVCSELREYGTYSGTVSFGVTVAPVSSLTAKGRTEYNVPESVTTGVVVIEVTSGGSSDGVLEANDIIIKCDSIVVETTSNLATVLSKHRIGDTISITVLRAGVETELSLTFKRSS